MKDCNAISRFTIERLSIYYRELRQIKREGLKIISSEKLSGRIGFSSDQIRKDLAVFGEFGKKGIGYMVDDLLQNIGQILGLHKKWNIAIIGATHLGRALANNRKLSAIAFNIEAVFDADPAKIGKYIDGIEISAIDCLEEIIAERNIHIAVIINPPQTAQDLADRLVAAGIKGIWNFAPVMLTAPETCPLINEDLSVGLASLSYYISNLAQDGLAASGE